MKVLVAEDDHNILTALKTILEQEGYDVVTAENGALALDAFQQTAPDFILLDIMMPEKDGYTVCREIRTQNTTVPVIFISAKSEEIDRVIGLELGADDYIMKPFGAREVIARIRAITRRLIQQNPSAKAAQSNESFQMADLVVHPASLKANRNDEEYDLSIRDVKILTLLCERKGQVVDRDAIFDACWGRTYLPTSRTLDQHISKLRKVVEVDAGDPKIIITIHGVGYRFPG